MRREELETYDRVLDWFLWTWLGTGEFLPRPRLTLEELLRLARIAHRDHYPTRRALRDVDLALAWLACELQPQEPRRISAHWRSERSEVPINVWADLGQDREVTITVQTATHRREILISAETTYALARQLLAAVAHARMPDTGGIRSDTVLHVPLSSETWTEGEEADSEPTTPYERRRR